METVDVEWNIGVVLTLQDNNMKTETLCHHKEIPQAKDSISQEPKKKILRLLANLEIEYVKFVAAESALFESLSKIKARSLRDPKREWKNSEPLIPVLGDFKRSIKQVESSHNRLTALLKQLGKVLADKGA